jgi:hypothetical protein
MKKSNFSNSIDHNAVFVENLSHNLSNFKPSSGFKSFSNRCSKFTVNDLNFNTYSLNNDIGIAHNKSKAQYRVQSGYRNSHSNFIRQSNLRNISQMSINDSLKESLS